MIEEIHLLKPEREIDDPELSIVVPALNEELTIGTFVDWCKQGIEEADIKAEILIVDSSTDKTPEIAVEGGARVLRTPKRGLGRAYIDSIPYIRGKYLILGDCDCTYDFRELKDFVKDFRSGSQYIMGSRFKGYIEEGAMPPLHQYFGTPFTTWILNFIYKSKFTDIHCGMRGITKESFQKMGLRSQGWEYASEMVLKSVLMGLKTTEVPIRFYKDQEGRLSHHRRMGWLSPWIAGWVNLRAMFIYGADFFLFKPGLALLFLGLALVVPLSFGPVQIGSYTLSLHWMLLGVVFCVLGLQCIYMGILNRVILDFGEERGNYWMSRVNYDRTTIASGLVFLLGMTLNIPLISSYLSNSWTLPAELSSVNYLSVLGLFLMISGFMTFTFTLLLHALYLTQGRQNAGQ